VGQTKLEALSAASRFEDLTVPRSNPLEKLKANLKDFHSIRINAQWRVIFKWFQFVGDCPLFDGNGVLTPLQPRL
jgi:plasmid maintenance system killer protein